MGGDYDMSCIWEEWQGEDIGHGAYYCHHPLGQPFCNYVDEQEECPLYKPTYEPSYIEEEVRQYLEYTEEKE